MSFNALEKQVQALPPELQNSIEMYALFVINQFRAVCPHVKVERAKPT